MTDADNSGSTKGWLDRIYGAFSGEPQNQKQLLELLKNLQSADLLDADELTMIEGVLQVDDLQVRDIMIPRGQMVVLDHEDSFAKIIEKITEFAQGIGLVSGGVTQSPLIGPAGNKEFFIHLLKAARDGGEAGPTKE